LTPPRLSYSGEKMAESEYQHAYYEAHKDEKKAANKAYYEANKEKWSAYRKEARERAKAEKAKAKEEAAKTAAAAAAAAAAPFDLEAAMRTISVIGTPGLPREATLALLKALKTQLAPL
jgi:alpha-galactosidase/6-phospho-beta-glucosidase family protein